MVFTHEKQKLKQNTFYVNKEHYYEKWITFTNPSTKTFGCTHCISKCVYLSIYNMRHITHKILAQKFIPPVSAVIDCTSSLRVHMSCYRIFLHEQFQKHIIGIPGLNQFFDTNVYVLYIFWLHLCGILDWSIQM